MSGPVWSRRTFLRAAIAGAAATLTPHLTLATATTEARLVLVVLRGAMDGLAAVPAYGDPAYVMQRSSLAIPNPAQKLNSLFALHPALSGLYARYRAKELLVLHAVATPYRERSHFDGQDVLESGSPLAMSREGWLNRLLPVVPLARKRSSEQFALALSSNIPLVLRGENRVSSWAPSTLPAASDDTLQRLANLYEADATLAARLRTALVAKGVAGRAGAEPGRGLSALASVAGNFLAAADGARIAVLEVSGWDTHANQGAEEGRLGAQLRNLDGALESLRTSLSAAWRHTAVLIVTEFGRTVVVNGTRGTDHGTGTCAFLVGGAVRGGRVIADWPGLATANLYEARDLRPTLDLRAVCKGVLSEHFRVARRDLDAKVFPGSQGARPLTGLIRG